MFGSFSNWLSTNLQIPGLNSATSDDQEKREATATSATASETTTTTDTAPGREEVIKKENEDIDKIENVESNKEQQAEGSEEVSKNKIFDSIKNDFNKILNIDKQEALVEAKEIGSMKNIFKIIFL